MPAASETRRIEERLLTSFMRVMLYTGAVFVLGAGIQLYVLSGRTDRFFAWTIDVPLTAAFLGALYWTALPVAVASARARTWALVRIGVPGVIVFLWMTLAATLVHLDKFHLESPDVLARTAAWVWLIVYVADPVLMSIAFVLQVRAPGVDPPRLTTLSPWFRAAIGTHAALACGAGVAMFVAPEWAGGWWAWPLTPLTGRAIGAWWVGLGLMLVTALWEDDWLRIRAGSLGYVVFGALLLVAVARFGEAVEWGRPSAWVLLAYAATALFLGVYGWARAPRTRPQ